MELNQLNKVLEIGEGEEFEFKQAKEHLPKSLWSTYSAFANSKGGKIILGIKEDRQTKEYSIEGINNVDEIMKDFWNTINNKQKVSNNILNANSIQIVDLGNKKIIIITVPNASRKDKPIYINNNPLLGSYKRYHDGDYRCEEKDVKVMFNESINETKDGVVIQDFNTNNINIETLQNYRKKFKIHKGETHAWNELNNKEFLYMIRALDRKTDKLTLAGLLMFGNVNDIIDVQPNYFLDYREIDFEETTERWSHRITSQDHNWSGNLWDFFCKIVNRLTADIKIPFVLNDNMMRIDNTEVHKCVREGLVNSLVHTDFSETGSIVIEKGKEYFKFSNPGNLRIPIDIVLLGGRSDPRNAILHQMFSYLGYGERAGSGLYMISTVWKSKKWISPQLQEDLNPNRITLTLNMKKYSNNVKNVNKNLNDTQIKIIEIMKENPFATIKELAEQIGEITEAGIKWNIKQLKINNCIMRSGDARNGKWIIL